MKVDFKVKTRRGKRYLEEKAPKTIENDKKAIFVKGGKTSQSVSDVLIDLYNLKKPLALNMKRRNPYHPFEDETPIERLAEKSDSSLFVFGSNSKKHPNSLVFGRLHDSHILDLAELRITDYKPASEFDTQQFAVGSKPCLVFEGSEFESDPDMKRVSNLLVDFFRGAVVDTVRLQGLEHVIVFTAKDKQIFMRVYKTILKKSATSLPRVELAEMGPSIDFIRDRTKLASDSLYKQACRRPKELLAKRKKNTSEDVFGNKLARVHIGKQNTDSIQTRKVKALRKGVEAPTAEAEAEEGSGDDDMEDDE
ncbi:unnamed protein product [Auanema sp. JU1783]|nr:unnamed protein product [Auanema sp. JU1783]